MGYYIQRDAIRSRTVPHLKPGNHGIQAARNAEFGEIKLLPAFQVSDVPATSTFYKIVAQFLEEGKRLADTSVK